MQTYTKGLCTIEITPDEYATSPQELGDGSIFLTGYHRQFSVESDLVDKEDCIKIFGKRSSGQLSNGRDYWVFGLEAYIHGSVRLALDKEGNFPDRRWDVSRVGLIFVAKELARRRDKARELALDHLVDWNEYINGEVERVTVRVTETGEEIESFGNNYGGGRDLAEEVADRYNKEQEEAKQPTLRAENIGELQTCGLGSGNGDK